MLQYIEDVKIGSIKPAAFVTAETTKRSYALELSKFKDFEFAHTGGVNDISVEQIEGRLCVVLDVQGDPNKIAKISNIDHNTD